MGIEKMEQSVAPRRGGVADVPGVKAVTGEDEVVAAREVGDSGPIGFAGAIDDGGVDRERGEIAENAVAMRREPIVLQVVVRVEERCGHGGRVPI